MNVKSKQEKRREGIMAAVGSIVAVIAMMTVAFYIDDK